MKHLSPSEIKPLIVETPVPMNETQRQLRGILVYWGDDGARWAPAAPWLRRTGPRYNEDAGCAIFAYCKAHHGRSMPAAVEHALNRSAHEFGYRDLMACADSTFDNARKMVLRAIELAA